MDFIWAGSAVGYGYVGKGKASRKWRRSDLAECAASVTAIKRGG